MFLTFCLYFRLLTIMNLIFHMAILENFMMSRRDKLYHHTISNKIKFNFLIILFGKISFRKSLPLLGSALDIERMTDFEKFGLQPYTLEPTKSKVPVDYGRNSVSYLASSNDGTTNGVNGRIGNNAWCICEGCAPMETNIEGVCCLDITEICKRRFSSRFSRLQIKYTFCAMIFQARKLRNLSNVDLWQVRTKVFYHFEFRDYRFL